MADKELRRMSRTELIEIIYALQQSEKSIRAENSDLTARLEEKTLRIESGGSIAEAALGLNRVFEEAQTAADQYLESVKAANSDLEVKTSMLLNEAEEEAEKKRDEAAQEAQQMLDEAGQKAQQIFDEAEQKAKQMLEEAESKIIEPNTDGAVADKDPKKMDTADSREDFAGVQERLARNCNRARKEKTS